MAAKNRKRLTIKEIKAKNYSPAYEKRLIRAARKGKTRQQARGHKPKEHIVRKESEKKRFGGLTGDQIKKIKTWYETLFNLRSYNGLPAEEDVIEFAQVRGYKSWTVYRNVWNNIRAKYLAAEAAGTLIPTRGKGGKTYYILGDVLTIDPYIAVSGVKPQGDAEWLYYH